MTQANQSTNGANQDKAGQQNQAQPNQQGQQGQGQGQGQGKPQDQQQQSTPAKNDPENQSHMPGAGKSEEVNPDKP